jgi:hypothetical protein
MPPTAHARTCCLVPVLSHRIELGHELAVGCAGSGEFAVAFLKLEPQIGGLPFERDDTGAEPEGAFVGGEQVGLQRCPGDGRAGGAGSGRAGLGGVDLAEQVAVPRASVPMTGSDAA